MSDRGDDRPEDELLAIYRKHEERAAAIDRGYEAQLDVQPTTQALYIALAGSGLGGATAIITVLLATGSLSPVYAVIGIVVSTITVMLVIGLSPHTSPQASRMRGLRLWEAARQQEFELYQHELEAHRDRRRRLAQRQPPGE